MVRLVVKARLRLCLMASNSRFFFFFFFISGGERAKKTIHRCQLAPEGKPYKWIN